MDAVGASYSKPGGGVFVWADFSLFGMDTESFCLRLLEETGVLIFPGRSFGEQWRSWVRISMLEPDARIAEAMTRLRGFVESL